MARVIKATIAIDADTGAVTKVSNDIQKMERSSQKSVSNMTSSFSGLKLAVAGVTTAITASTVVLAKGFLATGMEVEKFRIQLKTITGSQQEAEKAFGWIKTFAKETPYELNQVTEAFVKLKGYGLDATDSLKVLGDTASAMGKPLMQAVEAYADAASFQFERLRDFGVTTKQVGDEVTFSWTENGKDMTKTVKKTSNDVTDALKGILSKFDGAMKDQSASLEGIWSNLKDSFYDFQTVVLDAGAYDELKIAVEGVKDRFESWLIINRELIGLKTKEWVDTITSTVKTLVSIIDILWTATKGLVITYGIFLALKLPAILSLWITHIVCAFSGTVSLTKATRLLSLAFKNLMGMKFTEWLYLLKLDLSLIIPVIEGVITISAGLYATFKEIYQIGKELVNTMFPNLNIEVDRNSASLRDYGDSLRYVADADISMMIARTTKELIAQKAALDNFNSLDVGAGLNDEQQNRIALLQGRIDLLNRQLLNNSIKNTRGKSAGGRGFFEGEDNPDIPDFTPDKPDDVKKNTKLKAGLTEEQKAYKEHYDKIYQQYLDFKEKERSTQKEFSEEFKTYKMDEFELAQFELQKQYDEYEKYNVNKLELDQWYNDKKKEIAKESYEHQKELNKQEIEDSKTKLQKWAEDTQSFNDMMSDVTVSMADNMANGFTNMFTSFMDGSKSAGEAFKSFAADVLKAASQMITKMLVIYAVQQLIGMVIGSSGGASGAAASSSNISSGTASPAIMNAFADYQMENGGILSGGFRAFASGGKVTKPTLGLVGEGRYNEAVVPLPDGNSIPVQMKGGSGGLNITNNITVQSGAGGTDQDRQNMASQIVKQMKQAIIEVIVEQKRYGGVLQGA